MRPTYRACVIALLLVFEAGSSSCAPFFAPSLPSHSFGRHVGRNMVKARVLQARGCCNQNFMLRSDAIT